MSDPIDDFLRAYDAWAESEELCAGPLFDRMLEARGAIDGVQREAEQKLWTACRFARWWCRRVAVGRPHPP